MSWLETKAKDLGIETASVPIIATGPLGPKKAKSTGATISLNLASTPGGRYLMSCPADVINIGKFCPVRCPFKLYCIVLQRKQDGILHC